MYARLQAEGTRMYLGQQHAFLETSGIRLNIGYPKEYGEQRREDNNNLGSRGRKVRAVFWDLDGTVWNLLIEQM